MMTTDAASIGANSGNHSLNGLDVKQHSEQVIGGLSEKERDLIDELRAAVTSHADTQPLQHFLNGRSTLLRYLRARSWSVERAKKMLIATLQWRREYRPEAVTWEEIAPEAQTGKQFLLRDKAGGVATDHAGRPVLVLRPRCENTKTWDRQMRFVIYHLEVTSWHVDHASTNDTGMTWLVDFVGYSMRNAPPVKSALHTLHILQNHYPERLGTAIAYLPPTVFSLTWKAIHPFMDTATRNKVTFINNVKKAREALAGLMDVSNLERCLCGDSDYVFDIKEYSSFRKQSDAIRQQELQ